MPPQAVQTEFIPSSEPTNGGSQFSQSNNNIYINGDADAAVMSENGAGIANNNSNSNSNSNSHNNEEQPIISWRPLYWFASLLLVDVLSSTLILLPIFHPFEQWEDLDLQHPFQFRLNSSLWDVAILAYVRVALAVGGLMLAYYVPLGEENHDNDDDHAPKSIDELEQESLEESYVTKLKRHVRRYSFACEVLVLISGVWISLKSLARLSVEIGLYDETKPEHPMFWLALAMSALLSLIECSNMDLMERFMSQAGALMKQHHDTTSSDSIPLPETDAALTEPLLPPNSSIHGATATTETTNSDGQIQPRNPPPRKKKGIDGCDYKPTWGDIIEFVAPDFYWLLLAIIFLLLSSICNVYVPHYTGRILDSLVGNIHTHNNTIYFNFDTDMDYNNDGSHGGGSILKIPGFVANIEKLVLVSILGGTFSGIRGAIFSTVGARCNARLRIQLMDSLLCQDIGFYDTTRTGDITSRLGSDTTLVGAAVTNNVNTFLRSIVRAAGVLIFMCFISWQLTLLAFFTVPAVSVLSKWYGRYIRKMSKAQQKKLADGNNISECAISSMATVRAFGAERVEMKHFEDCMDNFLKFNRQTAIATFGYQTFVGALPQLVQALVLFYGGLMVQSDRNPMTGGQLITFVLYLTTLADSFNSLGGVYASLSRAVGASEKVFALMHRKPRRTIPPKVASCAPSPSSQDDSGTGVVSDTRMVDMEQQQQQQQQQQQIIDPVRTTVDNNCQTSESVARSSSDRQRNWLNMLLRSGEKRQSRVTELYTRGLYPQESFHNGGGTRGEISFQNVEFCYPARTQRVVLDRLNLTIPAGKVCALFGTSGSGKSSIVKLIQNLYEPTKGKVCIDGIDVRKLSPQWLTRHVAVVSQEPTLFARSVRDNIIYGLDVGESTISDQEIEQAARLANAHSFIERLPHGYDAEVGERGIQLSGGQKQRIAIARAVVRSPRILLLDESTSALDSESEFAVQQAIDDMISKQRANVITNNSTDADQNSSTADHRTKTTGVPMTVLIVAHRLSTVRNADIIFVVENGKVVEQGSHAYLLSFENGIYKALVSRQMNSH